MIHFAVTGEVTLGGSPSQKLSAAPSSSNIRFDNPGDGEDAWPKRRDHVAAQLRFFAPDVFGTQEGLLRQLEYLNEQLPGYQRIGVGRDDGKDGGEFSALFFKIDRFKLLDSGTFWLSATPDVVSKGWDAALPRVCTYVRLRDKQAKKNLWVFNTHFDHVGKTARKESAELILKKIREKNTANEPVIVMGDFNAEPIEAQVSPSSAHLYISKLMRPTSLELRYNLDHLWILPSISMR